MVLDVVPHSPSEQLVTPVSRIEALDEVPVPRVVSRQRSAERHLSKGMQPYAGSAQTDGSQPSPVVLRLDDLVVHPQHEIAKDVVARRGRPHDAARLVQHREDLRIGSAGSARGLRSPRTGRQAGR